MKKALSRTDLMPAVALLRLRLFAVLAFTGLVAPGIADAQNLGEVDARLSRVERVLDQSLLEQLRRVDSLERELRQLRGELERLNNEVVTLKKRNRDLYADAEERLSELENSAASGDAFGIGGTDGFNGLDEGGLDEGNLDGEGVDPLSGGGAGAAGSQGVFVTERGRSDVDALPTRTNATQAEKAAYTRAYDLLARGQNGLAVTEFDVFLNDYPDGPYSFNAWYWKGEAMYAERRFEEAISNFRQVTDRFPTSTKVPDAQLKIGFSLYEQGQYDSARLILERVQDEYQGRSAAVLARKRLQKMDREGL